MPIGERMVNIFITGITGFVGSAVAKEAMARGIHVKGQASRPTNLLSCNVTSLYIDRKTDWSDCFSNIDCVVHCAARVHQMDDDSASPLDQYREVNTLGTLNLARQAAASGVKRFVFISSIKVNGEYTSANQPFIEEVTYPPVDPYGLSKFEAEEQLMKLAKETDMEVVIIRPPLIYGPGVKANFLSMMNWVYKKLPLPLGRIHNRRSLVFVDNLVDLILTTLSHPLAANQTFLVSDGHDVSVTQLLQTIAHDMNVRSTLLPIPQSILYISLSLLGKKNVAQKLVGSLQIDISKTKERLGWTPKYSFTVGVHRTVTDYLVKQESK